MTVLTAQTATVGAEVFISRTGSWNTTHSLATVDSITKTEIRVASPACGGGKTVRRFSIKTGREFGSDGNYLSWNVEGIKASKATAARNQAAADQFLKVGRLMSEYRSTHGSEAAADAIRKARELLDEAEKALNA